MIGFRRNSPRPWLLITGGILAVFITAGAMLSISQSRQRTMQDGSRELSNLALAIAEQTDRAFQSVELVQTSLIERFDAAGVRNRDDFARIASESGVYQVLRDKISGLPQADAITLIDADGKLLNFSRYWPTPDVNVADREYFKALKANANLSSYVSTPVPNRGTGTWTIYLARKVTGRNGEFLGLILGALRVEHFEKFYAAMSLSPFSAISLLRRDGLVLARHPHLEPSTEHSILADSRAIREAIPAGTVTERQTSPMDGKDRLVSVRALSRYPLLVAVGEETNSVLSDWRHTSVHVVLGTILIDFLIALAVFLGMRQLQEQREVASVAHRAARHDLLTGLPNRLLLRESLADRLSRDGRFALLCIDLDRFKAVNDSFGHPAGDELLTRVADRLRTCVRVNDLVARIGGDEFAILHSLVTSQEDGAELGERVLRSLAAPFRLDRSTVQIGASIGVVIRPDDGCDAAELMRNGDLALYRAKEEGRGRWRRFEPLMAARLRDERALERDLGPALEQSQFGLHFQPIVSLATNRATGFEALLRWEHPERGLLSPCEFIPMAEASGLIVPIGEWVIHEACRQAAAWPQHLTIAVNLSPAQLSSGRVVETVALALDSTRLDPRRLELEITETALLHDDDAVLGALHKLRALGVRIALDDFGVGYSSLSHVTSFPFDRIKIDRSFVQKMKISESSRSVVCTILQLAERLKVSTTGEGVETSEQVEALRDEGCTEAQGFYFGRPQSAATLHLTSPGTALRLVAAA